MSRMLATNTTLTELSLAKCRLVDSQLELLVRGAGGRRGEEGRGSVCVLARGRRGKVSRLVDSQLELLVRRSWGGGE